MASMQSRKKYKRPHRQGRLESPTSFNIKLFVALGLLLIVLLMKKYDLSIGDFNIDSLYKVVYYNEDLNVLKEKFSLFNTDSNETEDTLQDIQSDDFDEPNIIDDLSIPSSGSSLTNEQELPITEDLETTIVNELIEDETND